MDGFCGTGASLTISSTQLIADARADAGLDERGDMLALLMQARYDDGEPIPDRHIADEFVHRGGCRSRDNRISDGLGN